MELCRGRCTARKLCSDLSHVFVTHHDASLVPFAGDPSVALASLQINKDSATAVPAAALAAATAATELSSLEGRLGLACQVLLALCPSDHPLVPIEGSIVTSTIATSSSSSKAVLLQVGQGTATAGSGGAGSGEVQEGAVTATAALQLLSGVAEWLCWRHQMTQAGTAPVAGAAAAGGNSGWAVVAELAKQQLVAAAAAVPGMQVCAVLAAAALARRLLTNLQMLQQQAVRPNGSSATAAGAAAGGDMEVDPQGVEAGSSSMGNGTSGREMTGLLGASRGSLSEGAGSGAIAAAELVAVEPGVAKAVAWGLQFGWSCLVGIMEVQLNEEEMEEGGWAAAGASTRKNGVWIEELGSALDVLLGGEGGEVVEELWELCVGTVQQPADMSVLFRGRLQEAGWVRTVALAARGAVAVQGERGMAGGKRSRGAGAGRVEEVVAAEEVWREAVEFRLLVQSLLQQ